MKNLAGATFQQEAPQRITDAMILTLAVINDSDRLLAWRPWPWNQTSLNISSSAKRGINKRYENCEDCL